jgi:hypothetical protein
MLLTVDFHKDFIDVEGITIASMLSRQSTSTNGAKLDAPKTNRFSGNSDASFRQKIFDITVAEIESMVEPDCIADDIGREPVAFISIHWAIVSIAGP